jgi:hypothetical protein
MQSQKQVGIYLGPDGIQGFKWQLHDKKKSARSITVPLFGRSAAAKWQSSNFVGSTIKIKLSLQGLRSILAAYSLAPLSVVKLPG